VHFILAHDASHNVFPWDIVCEIHDFPFCCELEIKRAGGFEDAMELEQTVRHHREIGHHVVLAQKAAQSLHHFRHVGVGLVQEFVKFALGLLVSMPGVLEGFNLRLAVVAARRFEEQIVIALGIERRVEINEVNGFIRNVLAEDLEIVAVIELIHPRASVRGKSGGVNSAFVCLDSSPRPSPRSARRGRRILRAVFPA
jgi:hypothetical protein